MWSLRRQISAYLSLVLGSLLLVSMQLQWFDRRDSLRLRLQSEAQMAAEKVELQLGPSFRRIQSRATLAARLESGGEKPVHLQLLGEGVPGLKTWSLLLPDGERLTYRGDSGANGREGPNPKGLPRWEKVDLAGQLEPVANYLAPVAEGRHQAEGQVSFQVNLAQLLLRSPMSSISGVHPMFLDRQGHCLGLGSDGSLARGEYRDGENPVALARIYGKSHQLVEGHDPLTGQPGWLAFIPLPVPDLTAAIFFPSHLLSLELHRLLLTFLIHGLILALALWVVVYAVTRHLSRPLEELTRAARALSHGNFEFPLGAGPRSVEVEHLCQAFGTMRGDLKAQIAERERESAAKARILKELELARQIQTANLVCPALLSHGGVTVVGQSTPARQVGGDFLDALVLKDGKIGLIIGDVAGKGIPAALYTVLARNAIKAALLTGASPAGVLWEANRLLTVDNSDCTFVTALVAVIDLEHDEVVFARAGHPAPVLWSGSNRREAEGRADPPLGLLEEYAFSESRLPWRVGEGFLVYTDGLTEAVNGEGQFFGEERLLAALEGQPRASAGELLMDAVERFRQGAEPNDDTTYVLAVRAYSL